MKTVYTLLIVMLSLTNSVAKKLDTTWVEKGSIQMDKLMTLDSLWAKKDSLDGKIVTVKLGNSRAVGYGTTGKIKDDYYHDVAIIINTNELKRGWDAVKKYLKNSSISYTKNDTLFTGNYSINIINEGDETGSMPKWVNYTEPFSQFDRKTIIDPAAHSTEKIFTGILLSTAKDYFGNHELFEALVESRSLYIFPLGVKYLNKKNK